MDHKEHLDEIAQIAAALHGQNWATLPMWARDRWKEAVKHTNRGGGDNPMDCVAGRAIDEWYKRRETPPAVEEPQAVPEKKTKTKK
jgi:hypothetical protein